ncbi:MAG: hypothetical protein LBF68_05285, partial [Christensenellaceae bacterium]|nr:hypothetical protein [Christensenellaceae bacterium]
NVPEDFGYLAVFECDDVDWVEKKVHDQFAEFRHYSSSKRKTEFFWSGCIEKAISYAKDLKGVSDKTNIETEGVVDDTGSKNRPRTTFEMIGLEVGTEIHWYNDKSITAVVADSINEISYNGKNGSISSIATEINASKGRKSKVNGFLCFKCNDIRLFKLRPDQQDKE